MIPGVRSRSLRSLRHGWHTAAQQRRLDIQKSVAKPCPTVKTRLRAERAAYGVASYSSKWLFFYKIALNHGRPTTHIHSRWQIETSVIL